MSLNVENSLVKVKSFDFAVRIFKLYSYIIKSKKDYVLSAQILRSGTSIGANIEEALGSQSQKDFFHKISISYREARETRYWLRLFCKTNFIEERLINSLLRDCEELIRMLGKIRFTIRNKMAKNM